MDYHLLLKEGHKKHKQQSPEEKGTEKTMTMFSREKSVAP